MKALALALLVACSSGYEPSNEADARPPPTLDAAPPQNHGCNMGNLPSQRTKTYVDSDPVDPQILNEFQDQIAGYKFPPLGPTLSGCDFRLILGTGAVVDGQWSFSVVPATIVASIPIVSRNAVGVFSAVHPTMLDALFFYNRNGAGTMTFKLRGRDITTGAAAFDIASAADTTGGAAYTNIAVTSSSGGILLPYVKPTEVAVWVEIRVTNVANVFGGAIPSFQNL